MKKKSLSYSLYLLANFVGKLLSSNVYSTPYHTNYIYTYFSNCLYKQSNYFITNQRSSKIFNQFDFSFS